MRIDRDSVVAALRRAVGTESAVALHEPCFVGREWEYVKDCLDSGWVSSVGHYVDEFERRLAARCGCRHAVAVVNGTAALHVALLLAGVRRGDEVIMPALTFVATANAVTYCGAEPHLVDADPATLGLDPVRLSEHLARVSLRRDDQTYNRVTGRRLACIVPMHTFGHPVDMDALNEVALRFGLPVVEDAAESLGSVYKGRNAGSLSLVSALSFNGNKIITTGGGGALLTDDGELARQAKHLTTTAKMPHRWEYGHDMAGFNYRLPNINAALGCAQLEQLDGFLDAKRRLAAKYRHELDGVDGVSFFVEQNWARSNYWLNVLLLDQGADLAERDALLAATNDSGLMTRPLWQPMHYLPMFANCQRMDLPVAEDLYRRLINLPSGPRLSL